MNNRPPIPQETSHHDAASGAETVINTLRTETLTTTFENTLLELHTMPVEVLIASAIKLLSEYKILFSERGGEGSVENTIAKIIIDSFLSLLIEEDRQKVFDAVDSSNEEVIEY